MAGIVRQARPGQFRRGAAERFAGHCPVLGRYGSQEGWVIERHFEQLQNIGARHVLLMIRAVPGQELGESLRAAQRLMYLADARMVPLLFSLGLRLPTPQVDTTVVGIAKFWAQFRSERKAFMNSRACFFLDFQSKVPSVCLDPIVTNVQGLNIITQAGAVSDDGRDLALEPWIEAPVHYVNEGLSTEDAIRLLRETEEHPFIIDGFNDFSCGHFLEPVVRLDV